MPWLATIDPATSFTYYYNNETGETSWTMPAPEPSADCDRIRTVLKTHAEHLRDTYAPDIPPASELYRHVNQGNAQLRKAQ